MIRGYGDLKFTSVPVTEGVLSDFSLQVCSALFTFRSETDIVDSKYLNLSGITQNKRSEISQERFFLDLEFQDVDFNTLQIAFGELSGLTDGVDLYEEILICPLTATTYVDARITADVEANVVAYNLTDRHVMIQAETAADVAKNIFHVDGATNTLTFSSANLNDALQIKVQVTNNSIGCIGGLESRGEFYDIQFEGAFFTTAGDGPYIIQIPELRRISAPQMTINERSQGGFTISFQAVCAQLDDYERKPFRIFSASHGIPQGCSFVLREDNDLVLREDDSFINREECQESSSEPPAQIFLLLEDDFSVLYEDGGFVLVEDSG